jgi:hypothetical protein
MALRDTQHSGSHGIVFRFVFFIVQVLGDRPSEAVDLLETSLLVKKTAFEAQDSAPLVPVSVRVILDVWLFQYRAEDAGLPEGAAVSSP